MTQNDASCSRWESEAQRGKMTSPGDLVLLSALIPQHWLLVLIPVGDRALKVLYLNVTDSESVTM